MIYQNKTIPQNRFLAQEVPSSFTLLLSNYDKHKIKKKAPIYYRLIKKEEKRIKLQNSKKTVQKEKEFFEPKTKTYNEILKIKSLLRSKTEILDKISIQGRVLRPRVKVSKEILPDKKKENKRIYECKLYEMSTKRRPKDLRLVGYSSHGDIYSRARDF